MSEELSGIDLYRARWKPNKERIAKLEVAYDKAHEDGEYMAMMVLGDLLAAELSPPRHLPIKRLDVTCEQGIE